MREMKLESCYISEYQRLLEEALNCSVASDDPEELWGELKKAVIAARQVFVFMARRAIPMIAFPRVRCMFIYIYIYIYMFVATYASMRCIRS